MFRHRFDARKRWRDPARSHRGNSHRSPRQDGTAPQCRPPSLPTPCTRSLPDKCQRHHRGHHRMLPAGHCKQHTSLPCRRNPQMTCRAGKAMGGETGIRGDRRSPRAPVHKSIPTDSLRHRTKSKRHCRGATRSSRSDSRHHCYTGNRRLPRFRCRRWPCRLLRQSRAVQSTRRHLRPWVAVPVRHRWNPICGGPVRGPVPQLNCMRQAADPQTTAPSAARNA